jgi:crotonobetainyl-CoA:carnitine CoA-transferase CaiB-like acyl-CoA transferase
LSESALAGVRVLELGSGIPSAYCARLLADFGADVVKVEPPGGDPIRRLGPYPGDEPHAERSGLFFVLNCNKRSAVLDPGELSGREGLGRLAREADLVIEALGPGAAAHLGVGLEYLQVARPDAVLLSITNFGQTGPYRDFKGGDLVLQAMGTEMFSAGVAGRAPVKQAGTSALFQAGVAAAVAAMAGLSSARRNGIGQWIDFSIFEALVSNVDRRASALVAYQFSGRSATRLPLAPARLASGVFPCADGYIHCETTVAMWPRLVKMLGSPPELLTSRWERPGASTDPELLAEFDAIFYRWLFERTKTEVWQAAIDAKLVFAPLNTTADLFADPVLEERGFWAEIDHAALGKVRLPGRPSVWSESPWSLRRPAPLLGEHTRNVLEGHAWERIASADPGDQPGSTPPPRSHARARERDRVGRAPESDLPLPLEGVRVLDLCVAWAGPFACQLMADLGAEVIKVENRYVWQTATRGTMAHPGKRFIEAVQPYWAGYPDMEPGDRPWNRCPMGINHFRNKYSMTCDLRRPEGLEIFARLVATSDVVYENNPTETIEKLGITYDWLRTIKPDIIYVRAPAFGNSGPRKNARAGGTSVESYIGHALARGYPDLDPTSLTDIFPSDAFAGFMGAFAAMAALEFRRRTGKGQLIENPQAECSVAMFTEAIMDYQFNRRVTPTLGNRDWHHAAPTGVYACAGEDRWLALSVATDGEWAALCRAMAREDLVRDRRFATAEVRWANHDALDELLAAWIAPQDRDALFRQLQTAGVPAGPVLSAGDCFADEQLLARGYFTKVSHPEFGTYTWPGALFRMSETPITIRRPPRALGEDNEHVYRTLLGFSDAEYAEFERTGHIGVDYDPAIP